MQIRRKLGDGQIMSFVELGVEVGGRDGGFGI